MSLKFIIANLILIGINFWIVKTNLNSLILILSLKDTTHPWKGGTPNLNNKAGVIIKLISLLFIVNIDAKIHKDAGDCLTKYFILVWVLEKDPLFISKGRILIIDNSSITHWKIGEGSVIPTITKIKFKRT
jgi:hypothetical protein